MLSLQGFSECSKLRGSPVRFDDPRQNLDPVLLQSLFHPFEAEK